MSRRLGDALADRLLARRDTGLLRRLRSDLGGIDFCSNDYLGLAGDPEIGVRIARAAGKAAHGSTGSRLISGSSSALESLEAEIADFHDAESALLFSTGYAANTGLFSCIAGSGDTVIADRLAHASILDGARLGRARLLRFRHNDVADLERKLEAARGNAIVGVESVYSMDGDRAQLADIAAVCTRYDAALVVDEAHSVGIDGPNGAGQVCAESLEEGVFARICTFGKALGLHGAAVLGSRVLRDYLVNFARPFIYSTAPPPVSVEAIRTVYRLLPELDERRRRLALRVRYFREQIKHSPWPWFDAETPVQSVIVPGNAEARQLAAFLQSNGLGVVPILSPTVPAGRERLRISVHSFNTEADIDRLFEHLNEGFRKWPATSLQA